MHGLVGVGVGLVGVGVGLVGVGDRLVDVGLIGVGFGFGLVGVWVGLIGVGDRLVGVGLVGVGIGLVGVRIGSACMLTLICKPFHLTMPHNLNTFHPSNMHISIGYEEKRKVNTVSMAETCNINCLFGMEFMFQAYLYH